MKRKKRNLRLKRLQLNTVSGIEQKDIVIGSFWEEVRETLDNAAQLLGAAFIFIGFQAVAAIFIFIVFV